MDGYYLCLSNVFNLLICFVYGGSVFELVPESGNGKLSILSDYKPLGLSRKLLNNSVDFIVVVVLMSIVSLVIQFLKL